MNTDFNKYQDTYKSKIEKSIWFSGQNLDFFTEIKARLIVKLAGKYYGDIKGLKVLDLGCGIGHTDSFLSDAFNMLYGVDIAEQAVERAKALNPTVDYSVYDGLNLPYDDNSFDIVFTICVMHHLQLGERNNFISEIKRILKNCGIIIVFEHNPFNCFTRYAVAACEFDKDALLMSKAELRNLLSENALSMVDEGYIIFFPFKGNLFRFIERGLKKLPIGAQYYLIAEKKSLIEEKQDPDRSQGN